MFGGETKSVGARGGGAAYTVTEECERLFCETLKAVFLGERNTVGQDSLVTGAHLINAPGQYWEATHGMVSSWVEVWDYVGDTSFRGFIAGEGEEKTLFVFLEDRLIGKDLKHG